MCRQGSTHLLRTLQPCATIAAAQAGRYPSSAQVLQCSAAQAAVSLCMCNGVRLLADAIEWDSHDEGGGVARSFIQHVSSSVLCFGLCILYSPGWLCSHCVSRAVAFPIEPSDNDS